MQRILMKKIGMMLVGVFLGVFSGGQAASLYVLKNSSFAGEVEMLEGVASKLSHLAQRQGVSQEGKDRFSVEELDLKAQEKGGAFNFGPLEALSKEGASRVFLSSGLYGLEAFQKLRAQKTQGIFVWLSHQIIGNEKDPTALSLDKLVGVANFIVLPRHVMQDSSDPRVRSLKKALKETPFTNLLEIKGVVHNWERQDLEESLKEFRGQIPPASKYMVVVLGGDVQQKDGKSWKYYRKEEAENLGRYVVDKMREDSELFVLATNAPRTGKHDPDTGKETDAHQEGRPLDVVSQAFEDCIPEAYKRRFKLYNFEFRKEQIPPEKKKVTLFKSLVAVVKNTKGRILLPGESTTMISQVEDEIPRGDILLYAHGAMQEVHFSHVRDEQENGVSLLTKTEKGYAFEKGLTSFPQGASLESNAQMVANIIWKEVQKEKGQ